MFELPLGKLISGFNIIATTSQAMILVKGQPFQFTARYASDILSDLQNIREIAARAELPVIETFASSVLEEFRIIGVDGKSDVVITGEPYARVQAALTRLQGRDQSRTQRTCRLNPTSRGPPIMGASGMPVWPRGIRRIPIGT